MKVGSAFTSDVPSEGKSLLRRVRRRLRCEVPQTRERAGKRGFQHGWCRVHPH